MKYDTSDLHSPIIKSYQLLIYGYIHQNKIDELYDMIIPTDIIELLAKFVQKTVLSSHKIISNKNETNNIFELWEASVYDKLIWNELYQYIHSLIFIVDVSRFDEYDIYDGSEKINKLSHSLDLFISIVKDEDKLTGTNIILFMNFNDKFTNKIINKNIPLNKCDIFKDYQYNKDEYINDRRYDLALRAIWKKFEYIYKTYNNEAVLLSHVTNALDANHVEKAFTDCLRILTHIKQTET